MQYVFPAKFIDVSCNNTAGCPSGNQIQVQQGDSVQTSITLNANSTQSGTAEVQIRRDIVWWPDNVAVDFKQSVTLKAGTNVIVLPTFKATNSTCGSPGCVNEYYLKVFWNGQAVYDPQDPSAREYVKVVSASSTTSTTSSGQTSTTSSCSFVLQANGLYATVCGTTTYTIATTASGLYWVSIIATDQYGNPLLSAPVSLDGRSSSTPAQFQTTIGVHTVLCGSLSGYTANNPSFTFTQTGATTLQTCFYSKAGINTTTLTVYVQYCNSAGICTADPDVQVSVQPNPCPSICGAQYVQSGNDGNAIFTVPTNSQYTVKIPAGGTSSTLSATANVGASPSQVTLTYRYTNNALSGLGVSSIPGGWLGLVVIVAAVVGFMLVAGKSGKWYRSKSRSR